MDGVSAFRQNRESPEDEAADDLSGADDRKWRKFVRVALRDDRRDNDLPRSPVLTRVDAS